MKLYLDQVLEDAALFCRFFDLSTGQRDNPTRRKHRVTVCNKKVRKIKRKIKKAKKFFAFAA